MLRKLVIIGTFMRKKMMSNFLDKWATESEKNKKICAREDLIIDITEDILIIMEDKGISKADLSRALGKSRSFVSQTLSGARNMTLKTLSDICYTLEINPNIQLLSEEDALINGNHHTYSWKLESLEGDFNGSKIVDINKYKRESVYNFTEVDRAYA